ncbi:haloacid dehalogenase [bacterium]|nr:MAG: haloacid dehalogenase [bacterium]
MKPALLICSDLDRTLLPNGSQPESPGVREVFARLVSREEVDLAYVSGRDLQLVLAAMETYGLPEPRFVIGDVGTSLHESTPSGWAASIHWQETILEDWRGRRPERLREELGSIEGLTLQENARQGAAKISFYVTEQADRSQLEVAIRERLGPMDLRYRLVWSTDEVEHRGLLDILPASASKLHAIGFLIDNWPYAGQRVVFAGDSGNDIEVLTSGLPSVLVANADEELRALVVSMAARRGHADALYLAQGGFLGTNGNYCAGILEGVAHFFPETIPWMQG